MTPKPDMSKVVALVQPGRGVMRIATNVGSELALQVTDNPEAFRELSAGLGFNYEPPKKEEAPPPWQLTDAQ